MPRRNHERSYLQFSSRGDIGILGFRTTRDGVLRAIAENIATPSKSDILVEFGMDESALAKKLAEKFHLSVPERRCLPSSGMSSSALVSAIQEILVESSWFPRDWRPDQQYAGIVIQATEDGYLIHERQESSVGRTAKVRTAMAPTLEEAVREFLRATFRADAIDEIPIDWSR